MSLKALVKEGKTAIIYSTCSCSIIIGVKVHQIYYLTCLNILRKDIWSKPKQEKKLIKKKKDKAFQSLQKQVKAQIHTQRQC